MSEPDKRDECYQVIQEAEDNRITIVTSALTIAEVLAVRYQPQIPSAKRDLVEKFFMNDWIVVRPLTRQVAEIARDLVWGSGIKPKDACHVATALSVKAPFLHTFDARLLARSELVGGTPLLHITRPHVIAPRLPLPGR